MSALAIEHEQEQVTQQQVGLPTVVRNRVEWATVPRVELLPPEIVAERKFVQFRKILTTAVAGVLVLLAAVVVWSQMQVNGAQASLDQAKAQGLTLQRQLGEYAEVPKIQKQLDAAQSARAMALSTDIRWYRFLDDLARSTPQNVWLEKLSVSMGAATNASTGATSAATTADSSSSIGTVSFAGKTDDFPLVASWLTQTGKVYGMKVSSLQSATRGTNDGQKVSFDTRVSVTADALSHRYDRKVK